MQHRLMLGPGVSAIFEDASDASAQTLRTGHEPSSSLFKKHTCGSVTVLYHLNRTKNGNYRIGGFCDSREMLIRAHFVAETDNGIQNVGKYIFETTQNDDGTLNFSASFDSTETQSSTFFRVYLAIDLSTIAGTLIFYQPVKITGANEIPSNLVSQFIKQADSRQIATEQSKYCPETLASLTSADYSTKYIVSGPLVSVLVSVTDSLEDCKASLLTTLNQSYRNQEIVVCGAAENVRRLLSSLKPDPRFKAHYTTSSADAAGNLNLALEKARGEYIFYQLGDVLWHPDYVYSMLKELVGRQGRYTAFTRTLTSPQVAQQLMFSVERQIENRIITLSSFCHHRSVSSALGGFACDHPDAVEDAVIRYCWHSRPTEINGIINQQIRHYALPRGNDEIQHATNFSYMYSNGVEPRFPEWVNKITVISWDMSRNHFSKAFNVAEALSRHKAVELVSFRFFDEPIFEPFRDVRPSFETKYYQGACFPDFFDTFDTALENLSGDLIYAIKPRLTSFGLALLDNVRRGTPVLLEANDLETVVNSPRPGAIHLVRPVASLHNAPPEANVPHATFWSELLDPLVANGPFVFTHNHNLDRHYGYHSASMRNVKDEKVYSPSPTMREQARRELGYKPDDRIILFAGLVRRHKGIFDALKLLDYLEDDRFHLLIVGSRSSPELIEFQKMNHPKVKVLPPQTQSSVARINSAADLVLLWLDPGVPASHFQMPYKLTDAFAMETAVIGSPVSDMSDLAQQGAMEVVPYGDFDALVNTIGTLFRNAGARHEMVKRARKIYEREFSFKSVVGNVALAAHRLTPQLEVEGAREFAFAFSHYRADR